MKTKTVPQILQEALDWLRDGSKWQRGIGDGQTCGCAGTAIMVVCNYRNTHNEIGWTWDNAALQHLNTVCEDISGKGIVGFNDSRDRGFSEIENLFQEAISRADQTQHILLDF